MEEWPLRATLGEGFSFKSWDDEYQLRLRVLDQTDFKVFSPGDQVPARSGLYIPRARVYFEGQLTRLFQYEVSIQRSVDGVWDLLDGNVNIVPDRRFQVRFGRMLVPYSYDWYDHLEQYFITPERALFPLNFGLSRSAGLMAHGFLFDDRLEYAAGGFDGHLTGLADNNTTRDVVGYFNLRPFLHPERFPLLRNVNVGASGFLGQQVSSASTRSRCGPRCSPPRTTRRLRRPRRCSSTTTTRRPRLGAAAQRHCTLPGMRGASRSRPSGKGGETT